VIAKAPPHWSETKILRNNGGLVGDVERFAREDRWWERDQPGSRDLASVNALLENCGLGRLTRYDSDFEERREAQKKENESGTRGVTGSEVAEHQRDKAKRRREAGTDDENYESYMPSANENAMRWAETLATRVDCTTAEVMPWYGALRNYVGKFPANAIGRDLDADTLRALLKQICSGGHDQ
jgi:hypothetical protein